MKKHLSAFALIVVCLSSGSSSAGQLHANARSVLPSVSNARSILSATTRHREWVNLSTDSSPLMAFVVYPERADKAPAVLVTVRNEPASLRARAVADQLAAEGFISIVPDVLTGLGPNHSDSDGFASQTEVAQAIDRLGAAELQRRYEVAQTYAAALPGANGTRAWVNLDLAEGRAEIASEVHGAVMQLPATPTAWPQLVAHLSGMTGNNPVFIEGRTAGTMDEHAMHMGHTMPMAAAQQTGGSGAARAIPGLGDKAPNLPASYYTATATLAQSKMKREYVDIPMGDVKLHAWVEYPAGTAKAGVVIVMQHAVGLDDWMRSVADQLAVDGFIAVAPDPWSGIGPNGGNRDSFQFDDEAMRSAGRINADETQRRYKAAREWALTLPRANGKSGSIGFCAGGNNSFRFAGEVPELNAAVVFYGTMPTEDLVQKINAPVLGFYGENDARVTSTVAPTTELMKKLGKSYESHIYPKVTHSFVYFQDLSVNRDALADAWPRVVAFFNKNLK